MSPPSPPSPSPSLFVSPQPHQYHRFNFNPHPSLNSNADSSPDNSADIFDHFTDEIPSSPPVAMPPRRRGFPVNHLETQSHRRNAPPTSPPAASTGEPSTKRRRANTGAAVPAVTTNNSGSAASTAGSRVAPIDIEDILDLTGDDTSALSLTLQKQRAEAVKSQLPPSEKPTNLTNLTCVICMDTPTDLTATVCGHLFCHTCLMEALIAGENRSRPGEAKRSQCPVCRKNISRTKKTDTIPLLMMKKGLATQPKKAKKI